MGNVWVTYGFAWLALAWSIWIGLLDWIGLDYTGLEYLDWNIWIGLLD